jgi:hypothetical protein
VGRWGKGSRLRRHIGLRELKITDRPAAPTSYWPDRDSVFSLTEHQVSPRLRPSSYATPRRLPPRTIPEEISPKVSILARAVKWASWALA